jgi:hypothetical protein
MGKARYRVVLDMQRDQAQSSRFDSKDRSAGTGIAPYDLDSKHMKKGRQMIPVPDTKRPKTRNAQQSASKDRDAVFWVSRDMENCPLGDLRNCPLLA